MTPKQAAAEIISILEEAVRRGASPPSSELRDFLDELTRSPGLKKARNTSSTSGRKPTERSPQRVGARRKKPSEVEMAKTIEELAQKLRDAFDNASVFETVLSDPETQALSKANVVTLFSRVFEPARPPKALTKPELFNAMRRERINRVRGRG